VGERRRPGSVAAGCLAVERGGREAGTPEGLLQPRGGGGLLWGLSHPELIAALDEFLWCLEGPRVDQVSDVAQQFADEEDVLGIFHRCRLQGGEVVPQDGGPGVAAHRIIQPLAGHLFGAEAVGLQEELLQLFVRVADGGGVPGQWVDGGNQRKRQFSQGPVEFCDRLGDVGRWQTGHRGSRTMPAANQRRSRADGWRRRPVVADSEGPWLANCCRLRVKSGHQCGGGISCNKEGASKVLYIYFGWRVDRWKQRDTYAS
jgi:hypothetical protein